MCRGEGTGGSIGEPGSTWLTFPIGALAEQPIGISSIAITFASLRSTFY